MPLLTNVPIITNELRSSIINHLTSGVIGFLIYMPELGLSDPTPLEYQRRINLTMSEAVEHEVGGLNLFGYQRCQPTINIEEADSMTIISYEVQFHAYEGSMNPFTHICLSRGSIFTIDPLTGNGRGDTLGTLIYASPVGSEITLEPSEEYIATLSLNLTNYVL